MNPPKKPRNPRNLTITIQAPQSKSKATQIQPQEIGRHPDIYQPIDRTWENKGNPDGHGRTAMMFVKDNETLWFKKGSIHTFLALNLIEKVCKEMDLSNISPTCKLSYMSENPSMYGIVTDGVKALHYNNIFRKDSNVDTLLQAKARQALPQLIPAIACDVALAASDRHNETNYLYSPDLDQWFVIDYDSCLMKKPGDKGFAGKAEDIHDLGELPYPEEIRKMLKTQHEKFAEAVNYLKKREYQDMYQLALKIPSAYYPDDLQEAYNKSNAPQGDLGDPLLESAVVEKNAKIFSDFLHSRTRADTFNPREIATQLINDDSDLFLKDSENLRYLRPSSLQNSLMTQGNPFFMGRI